MSPSEKSTEESMPDPEADRATFFAEVAREQFLQQKIYMIL